MNAKESIFTTKDFTIQFPPPSTWRLNFGGNQGIYFCFTEAPCWFWRKMQRLVLGFKWEKIEP